jgi:hypothetical protein
MRSADRIRDQLIPLRAGLEEHLGEIVNVPGQHTDSDAERVAPSVTRKGPSSRATAEGEAAVRGQAGGQSNRRQ